MMRFPHNRTYALAANAAAVTLSEVIPMENMAGGSVETTAAQTITIYGCNQNDPVGKTFVAAHPEADASQSTITAAAAGCFPLPSECYCFRYIVLVDASGGTVYLHVKS